MRPLPALMAAPSGAAKARADHPALPVTIGEIVGCAEARVKAGADGLHAHVRDAAGRRAAPGHLDAPLAEQARLNPAPDWAACAFGPAESACLLAACRAGGKARIGFENNLLRPDGGLAADNAAQVAAFLRLLATATAGAA